MLILPHMCQSITRKMCFQLAEIYSACHCLYYQHSVDLCAAHNKEGHVIQPRIILVGYVCRVHSQGDESSRFIEEYCQRATELD